MSSCTECHGMAGQEYDGHTSNNCPRFAQSNQDQAVTEFMESHGFKWQEAAECWLSSLPPQTAITNTQALFFYTICQKVEREAYNQGSVDASKNIQKMARQHWTKIPETFDAWLTRAIELKEVLLTPPQDTTRQEEEAK